MDRDLNRTPSRAEIDEIINLHNRLFSYRDIARVVTLSIQRIVHIVTHQGIGILCTEDEDFILERLRENPDISIRTLTRAVNSHHDTNLSENAVAKAMKRIRQRHGLLEYINIRYLPQQQQMNSEIFEEYKQRKYNLELTLEQGQRMLEMLTIIRNYLAQRQYMDNIDDSRPSTSREIPGTSVPENSTTLQPEKNLEVFIEQPKPKRRKCSNKYETPEQQQQIPEIINGHNKDKCARDQPNRNEGLHSEPQLPPDLVNLILDAESRVSNPNSSQPSRGFLENRYTQDVQNLDENCQSQFEQIQSCLAGSSNSSTLMLSTQGQTSEPPQSNIPPAVVQEELVNESDNPQPGTSGIQSERKVQAIKECLKKDRQGASRSDVHESDNESEENEESKKQEKSFKRKRQDSE